MVVNLAYLTLKTYFEYELICVVDEKNFLIKTRSFVAGKWHEEINDADAYNIYA